LPYIRRCFTLEQVQARAQAHIQARAQGLIQARAQGLIQARAQARAGIWLNLLHLRTFKTPIKI